VFHRNREDLEALGIIFCDMDTAVREHPDLVRKYFGTIIPPNDNKFAALNSAVWSGGSFIYVPPNVIVDQPLQAYFRINAENMGQFERTLIIADVGAQVHYIEGCSAPVYTTDSLHSAVVELVALEGSRITIRPSRTGRTTSTPGHKAGQGGGRGARRMDRRQHRLPSHHEYPSVYLMGPKARARCSRSPTPAPASTRTPGPRWSTPPRDHVDDRVEVDLQGHRHHHLPGPGARGRGRQERQELRAVRRAPPRRHLRLGDQALHGGRRAGRPIGHEATVSKWATTSSSTS